MRGRWPQTGLRPVVDRCSRNRALPWRLELIPSSITDELIKYLVKVRITTSCLRLISEFTAGGSCEISGYQCAVRVNLTLMALRAVCTRPGNVFTAAW